jgi:hypothetical protein
LENIVLDIIKNVFLKNIWSSQTAHNRTVYASPQ